MLAVIDIDPNSLPFSGDWHPFAGGFNIVRDFPVLAIGSFVLYFGIGTVICARMGKNCDVHAVRFYLFHAIFVPIAIFATAWCYQHPEQFRNDPDTWMTDLRPVWPIFAVIDLCFIAKFLSSKKEREAMVYGEQAADYMRVANQLLAEGRIEEADAAYAKGRWLLDKCKRR